MTTLHLKIIEPKTCSKTKTNVMYKICMFSRCRGEIPDYYSQQRRLFEYYQENLLVRPPPEIKHQLIFLSF